MRLKFWKCGCRIGRLWIVWWNFFTRYPCLEVTWEISPNKHKPIFYIGQRRPVLTNKGYKESRDGEEEILYMMKADGTIEESQNGRTE